MTNKIREILRKVHNGDYDNDDGELCGHCLTQAESALKSHFKSYLKSLVPKRKDESRWCFDYTYGHKMGWNDCLKDIERNIDNG